MGKEVQYWNKRRLLRRAENTDSACRIYYLTPIDIQQWTRSRGYINVKIMQTHTSVQLSELYDDVSDYTIVHIEDGIFIFETEFEIFGDSAIVFIKFERLILLIGWSSSR